MDKEGKKRLLKLASELERCSKGQVLTIPGDGKALFDMGTLVETIERGEDSHHACGTAACAIGFAGLHPWFRQRGLEWSPRLGRLKLNNRGSTFQNVASRFFGVTEDDAGQLFNPIAIFDETPKQVAARIRAFVKAAP